MSSYKLAACRLPGLFIILLGLFLGGCNSEPGNISFSAVIESVSANGIMVSTADDVSFTRAAVFYSQDLQLDFQPAAGQTVILTIRPEVRESYPVQVTAVKIELIKNDTVSYQKITAAEAKGMTDNGQGIILDVRTEEEYNEGHIAGALLLPLAEVEARAAEVLPDKAKAVLVYCRSGRRSALAAQALTQLGYSNVYDLGGINSWPYDVVK